MKKELHIPRETLRKHARKQIEDGAFTEAYRADRARVIEALNAALATEIVCTLRYRNHYYRGQGVVADAVVDEFLEHAQQEQEHADRIAKRIIQLGGHPDMNPDTLTERSHAEYTAPQSLADMIRENLIAERIAIEAYSEVIRWLGDDDPTTRRMFEDILAQEEEHADDMATLLGRNQ